MPTKSVVLFARVQPQMAEELDRIVDSSIGDRADHIRRALEEYISRHTPKPDPVLDALADRFLDCDPDPYPAIPA